MGRKEKLEAFIIQHDNVNFNSSNIPKILENLKLAEQNNCLREFLLNKKPYISRFPFFAFNNKNQATRRKDQISIVFALNIYGTNVPGFAERLNSIMKEFANGSSKQMQVVAVLMRAQMELQTLGISLINFVDAELLMMLNKRIKKIRPCMIFLMLIFLFGGALGMPGLAIAGLPPLSFVSMAVFLYGWIKGIYWLGMKPFPEELIAAATHPICELKD